MQSTSRQDQMFSIVEQYLKGGQIIKDICQQYNITRQSFYYWFKKYKELHPGNSSENKFIPVKIITPSERKSPCITIVYPNKVSITIQENSDVQFIKSLVTLL